MQKRLECTVIGRVQFVMYRDFAARAARNLGLVGTVKNNADKTVTVIAEGDESRLAAYLKKLAQGSMLSRVDRIDVVWREPAGTFSSFDIVY